MAVGVHALVAAVGAGGGADVLGRPASGLPGPQALRTRALRQMAAKKVGMLRVVTGITSP